MATKKFKKNVYQSKRVQNCRKKLGKSIHVLEAAHYHSY